jgi:hypothetical protein
MSVVVFNRNFQRFQGGHLKVFDYFEHVRSSPSHQARIRFSSDSVWDASNPWSGLREEIVAGDDGTSGDVLFLAGMDWRSLEPEQRMAPPLPVVNLIQTFYAPRGNGPMHGFLVHPAIRICVSAEVQASLETIGTVAGPIFTVPIGIDLERLPQPLPAEERNIDCVVLAVKDRELGRPIAKRLGAAGYRVLLIDEPLPRDELLEAMARARVTVHLPARLEGAYLPALESMALGAAVVCPDCIGNRSFCRDGDTCLVPERSKRAIVSSALTALTASAEELEPMLASARAEAMSRAIASERHRFLQILDRVEDIWASR